MERLKTMKLLALSDLHGDYTHIKKIYRLCDSIDAVLICGDITNFGPDQKSVELFKIFKQPVLAVPGNCDNPSIIKTIDENAISLHESSYKIDDITFVGVGGSSPTPFNTLFEMPDKKFAEILTKLTENLPQRAVLVSHQPPYHENLKLGSKSMAKFIDKFELIICGHIHEAKGSFYINKTLIVNPGPASQGNAALITINKTISVRFIEV